MKYVKVARHTEDGWPKGFELDPRRYLEHLPVIAPDLPPGARRFATDPDHYDFAGPRCVKDLTLMSTLDVHEGTLHLYFKPNEWKHDRGLRITYQGVQGCGFEPTEAAGGYGTVMLDELLPSSFGVSHDVFMTGGTLRVDAEDVHALWSE